MTSWDSCSSQATKVWLFFPDLEVDPMKNERSPQLPQGARSLPSNSTLTSLLQEPNTGQGWQPQSVL